jgi:cytoskeleton protein RodZ
VIIVIKETVEKYQREKQVEATAVKVSPLAQPALVPEGTKAADGATAAATTSPTGTADTVPANPATIPAPDMNAQPAPAPTPAPPAAADKIADTKNLAPPPPPPKSAVPSNPPPAASNPVPAPKAEAPANESTAGKKTGNVEIILEALDKVDVKFEVKGQTKKISLGPTQVHTIHADQPLTLDVSDGGALNVIVNGRDRGVPGELGKPKTIKVP